MEMVVERREREREMNRLKDLMITEHKCFCFDFVMVPETVITAAMGLSTKVG